MMATVMITMVITLIPHEIDNDGNGDDDDGDNIDTHLMVAIELSPKQVSKAAARLSPRLVPAVQ